MTILIADCGATKADWYATGGHHVRTAGINMVHTPLPDVCRILDEVATEMPFGIDEVHFFAAGAMGEPPLNLQDWFPGAAIEYTSDIYAAARAVCGRSAGIAAILGTGANTCQWDGEKIVRQLRSGGFVLGDEGSAAVLGKLFLSDYIKGIVPESMADAFSARFPQDYSTLVKAVYSGPAPARFLGSIALFVLEQYHQEEYVKELTDNNFRSFFRRTVCRYDALPMGVVGGFGYACRDIIRRIGEEEFGVQINSIEEAPLQGLIRYYGL